MSLKNISGLKREDFQAEVQGKQTDLFILRNNKGCEVAITNYGGALVAIMVPDRDGKMANVIQGHDNIQEVISSPEPFLSTLIGRYGNRICKVRDVEHIDSLLVSDFSGFHGSYLSADRNLSHLSDHIGKRNCLILKIPSI